MIAPHFTTRYDIILRLFPLAPPFSTEIPSPDVQCTCRRLRLQQPLWSTPPVERCSACCSSLRLLAHKRMHFCMSSVLTRFSAAAFVKSINMSHSFLTSIVAADLQQYLQRFPALEHVNVSCNPGLIVLSFDFMKAAARYMSFDCAGCSLIFPPQRIFASPEIGPRVIDEFMKSSSLNISKLKLTPQKCHAIALVLQKLHSFQHINMSGNPLLGTAGVTSIVASLSGA